MSLHVTPVTLSSISVRTTYHLTWGTDPSSSSGSLLPHRRSLEQTQMRLPPVFHTYAPFTPESHQITFEARPPRSFCCCSIHSHLPWIRIQGENLHKFTQPFVSERRSAPASGTPLPPVLVRTGCADSKLVCHFRQYLAFVFWLRLGSDRCCTDVSSLLLHRPRRL